MNYTVNFNKLVINGKVVFEAPAEIDDTLTHPFNSKAVVIIYDGFRLLPNDYHDITNPRLKDAELQKIINQNVICIDSDGNMVWRIEPTGNRPVDHFRFIRNRPGLEGVWVYRRDAEEYKIDPNNGKILEFRMGI